MAPASATIIGSETNTDGFVGNFVESLFPGAKYLVASDGEAAFDPFGYGHDTSDGINFSDVGFIWNQAADSFWTAVDGKQQTWVLPADLTSFGCGIENNTTCEPVGHFISSAAWNPSIIGIWDILDSEGNLSDRIITKNDANGANLWFYSDPTLSTVPLPAALPLLASGLGALGVAGLRKRRKGVSAAVAA